MTRPDGVSRTRNALHRWWQWETRLFRKDHTWRPGERTALLVGLAVVLVGVAVSVVSLSTR